jgi:hypothetical protein
MAAPARIILFALEDLRQAFGALVPPEADPRQDTTPFRAFRLAILSAVAPVATAPLEVSMWWEGTYNGYHLALAFAPAEGLPALAPLETVCPVESERLGVPRADAVPVARLWPGRWELVRDPQGAIHEAPFGAATGHFGAPGIRRLT